jgi:hypothetical protein
MSLLDGSPGKAFIAPVSAAYSGDKTEFPTSFISTTMKFRLFTGFAAALCVLLASCYPYQENPPRKKTSRPPSKTETAEQVKLKEQETLKKQQEEELKKTQEAAGQTVTPPSGETTTTQPQTTTPPAEPKRTDYAFANKVPGKEGFVFSPYNNKVVDVRDIPSGTLVQDPTYPASEKKYFRVP